MILSINRDDRCKVLIDFSKEEITELINVANSGNAKDKEHWGDFLLNKIAEGAEKYFVESSSPKGK
jgi:hypothetical protein